MDDKKTTVIERITARRILNRTRELLSDPQNVKKVAHGRIPELNGSYDKLQAEKAGEELSKLGYHYSFLPCTNQQFASKQLITEIKFANEENKTDVARSLVECNNKLEDNFTSVAIETIIEGLQDGSIPMDYASQTDEQIVESLINSDGTKEAQIESTMAPIRHEISEKFCEIVYGPVSEQ